LKPRITFRHFGEHLASSRLRSIIPQRELAELGYEQGRDILVIGKHGWNWDTATHGYRKVVYDVCDAHFDTLRFGAHYLEACARADAVTCNSHEMRRVIKAKTGRDAWCIPDPYEAPESEARVHGRLVWFGHASNLHDLVPWIPRLAGRDLTILSNALVTDLPAGMEMIDWSPQEMDSQFARAGLSIIPTGKSMAKSANRAIESIRRGVFPVCGYLPAHGDLGIYQGDIVDGIDWSLSHQDEVMRRIKGAQAYVAHEYNPKRIARMWLQMLSFV
jgi:hypothetical protein